MVLRAKNTDPLNIQAVAESGPENQMSLNVVDDFELASQTLNAARGQVGAVGKRLVSNSNSLNIEIENLTLSESG